MCGLYTYAYSFFFTCEHVNRIPTTLFIQITLSVISMNTGIMIPLFKYKPFFIQIRDFVQITLSAYRYCCQKRIFDSKSRISSLWVVRIPRRVCHFESQTAAFGFRLIGIGWIKKHTLTVGYGLFLNLNASTQCPGNAISKAACVEFSEFRYRSPCAINVSIVSCNMSMDMILSAFPAIYGPVHDGWGGKDLSPFLHG